MKTVCIRIDDKVAEIVDRNAAQQGIKPTRYVRSLIEKGLVLDHQIQTTSPEKIAMICQTELWIKLSELLVENVMLTRKVIRQTVQTIEEQTEVLQMARQGAQQYLEKYRVAYTGDSNLSLHKR